MSGSDSAPVRHPEATAAENDRTLADDQTSNVAVAVILEERISYIQSPFLEMRPTRAQAIKDADDRTRKQQEALMKVEEGTALL